MRLTRKKFVLRFFGFGYALDFVARFVLNQAPEQLWASPSQEAWQRYASTLLSPLRVALVGPVAWLQQDPDPPPPFRFILLTAYWSALALGTYQLLSRKSGEPARKR
jgi:hypothetical protein